MNHSILGLACILAVCWAFSENRRRVSVRIIVGGIVLQTLVALCCLPEGVSSVANLLSQTVQQFGDFAAKGSDFLWGERIGANKFCGTVFVVHVLPTIVFFYAMLEVVYFSNVTEYLANGLRRRGGPLLRLLGISDSEAIVAVANVFIGQTQAPGCIERHLPYLRRSEILTVMILGFSTTSGELFTILAASVSNEPTLQTTLLRHMLTATLMSVPAAFVISRTLVPSCPEELAKSLRQPGDAGPSNEAHRDAAQRGAPNSLFEAICIGARKGVSIAVNIAAVLIALLGLLEFVNWLCHRILIWEFHEILGLVGMPFVWLLGFAWEDCYEVAKSVGLGFVGTEFLAFEQLGHVFRASSQSPEPWMFLAVYPIFSFANLPSLAIQTGVMIALVPHRRADIVALAPRALLGGLLASCMTTCIAAFFIVPRSQEPAATTCCPALRGQLVVDGSDCQQRCQPPRIGKMKNCSFGKLSPFGGRHFHPDVGSWRCFAPSRPNGIIAITNPPSGRRPCARGPPSPGR